jgi:hypothetical protein
MFRRFLAWLEDYIADAGIVGLVGAVTGILAFGGTLSAIFGNSGVKSAAFAAAILAALGMFILLAASRIQWRKRAEQDQRLLTHYCNILQERFNSWRITDWNETIVVDVNGDTRQRITVHAVVESEELELFRVRIGCRWNQSPRYRRKVKVKVQSLEADGMGGTRPDTITSWLIDGRLEILTHFNQPIGKNEQLDLSMEIDWPKKCAPLMNGEPDEFVMRFTRYIENTTWTIILPAGTRVYVDLVGLKPLADSYEVQRSVNSAGNSEIRLTARAIEPYRLFGLRLDRK